MSITRKVMIIALVMMLTITVSTTLILIDESQSDIEQDHQALLRKHQQLLSLYARVLDTRMVMWFDVFTSTELNKGTQLSELIDTLAKAREYLALNMQMQSYWLYDDALVTGVDTPPAFISTVVDNTRATLQSQSAVHCQTDCLRYVSMPLMLPGDEVPVLVVSLRMTELLSLLNQTTGAYKLALVSRSATTGQLNIASRLTQENREVVQAVVSQINALNSDHALSKTGNRVVYQNKQLLVSLLPFTGAATSDASILLIQDITRAVEQGTDQKIRIIGLAAVVFSLFGILLYMFLRRYGMKLTLLSRRLPLLSEHRFDEFREAQSQSARTSFLRDELDDLEDVADYLAAQLEEIDGQMAKNNAKLEKMAMFDSLTGLPNRFMLSFQIEQYATANPMSDSQIALLFMDLDDFKKVNDSDGHDVGDRLLKAAAMRISKPLGEQAIVSRFGGDEFVVLLTNVAHRDQVEKIANDILAQFSYPIDVGGKPFYISLSIGIAFSNVAEVNTVELLRHADIAMYDVKSKQGAGFRIFDATMNQHLVNKAEMEREARVALKDNQFFLALQPQLALDTNKLVGFEALIRWRHPQKGLIAPDEFIPVLETTPFMLELDYWVITHACRLMNMLSINGYPDIKMAINLSSGQFIDMSLPDFILEQVNSHSLQPSQLCLELTETVLVSDLARAVKVMKRIQAMGCMIAIDDFGTGYSSLSYLKSLPADFIKIDRSFITGLEESADDMNIVQSIIHMAHQLNLDIVAEGIESEAQLNLLRRLKCQFGQGYFIGRPIDEDDLWQVLSQCVHSGIWQVETAPYQRRIMAD